MRFAFAFGSSTNAPSRSSGLVRRLLVLGDLRGNGTPSADRLLDRSIVKVDIDNLDAVLARYAPAVQLGADAGSDRVEFRRFDDFHPDGLVEAIPALRRLRDLRARLGHPSTFASAVAELQSEARSGNAPYHDGRSGNAADSHGAVADEGRSATDPPQPDHGGGLSALDRLLGRTAPVGAPETLAARPPRTAASAADELIRQAVAPHIVPAPSPQLPQMLAAVDAAMTDAMRAVLHDRGFQAVEAVWRAVQWLVSTLELGETLELRLLHVTRDELASGSALAGDLWRRLVERESSPDGGLALSALIGNFEFGPSEPDVAVLAQMGTMAAALGVPFIAGASSALLGVSSLAAQPDPREWAPLEGDAEARWHALRSHPAAAHIGLALPRFLLRLPYGKRTDAIAAFEFEEQPVRPEHESFLWGNGAFAYAVAVARAIDPDGDPSTAGSIEGLPAFVFATDDGPALQPPAEIAPSEAAVAAIQTRGLMPLISFKDRDAIRLVMATSIAG
jgi:type VI secretion system protein ImpC